MPIWDRQSQIALQHEGMLPSGIGSVEAMLTEASDQNIFLTGPKAGIRQPLAF
jgi:hypothetical protein